MGGFFEQFKATIDAGDLDAQGGLLETALAQMWGEARSDPSSAVNATLGRLTEYARARHERSGSALPYEEYYANPAILQDLLASRVDLSLEAGASTYGRKPLEQHIPDYPGSSQKIPAKGYLAEANPTFGEARNWVFQNFLGGILRSAQKQELDFGQNAVDLIQEASVRALDSMLGFQPRSASGKQRDAVLYGTFHASAGMRDFRRFEMSQGINTASVSERDVLRGAAEVDDFFGQSLPVRSPARSNPNGIQGTGWSLIEQRGSSGTRYFVTPMFPMQESVPPLNTTRLPPDHPAVRQLASRASANRAEPRFPISTSTIQDFDDYTNSLSRSLDRSGAKVVDYPLQDADLSPDQLAELANQNEERGFFQNTFLGGGPTDEWLELFPVERRSRLKASQPFSMSTADQGGGYAAEDEPTERAALAAEQAARARALSMGAPTYAGAVMEAGNTLGWQNVQPKEIAAGMGAEWNNANSETYAGLNTEYGEGAWVGKGYRLSHAGNPAQRRQFTAQVLGRMRATKGMGLLGAAMLYGGEEEFRDVLKNLPTGKHNPDTAAALTALAKYAAQSEDPSQFYFGNEREFNRRARIVHGTFFGSARENELAAPEKNLSTRTSALPPVGVTQAAAAAARAQKAASLPETVQAVTAYSEEALRLVKEDAETTFPPTQRSFSPDDPAPWRAEIDEEQRKAQSSAILESAEFSALKARAQRMKAELNDDAGYSIGDHTAGGQVGTLSGTVAARHSTFEMGLQRGVSNRRDKVGLGIDPDDPGRPSRRVTVRANNPTGSSGRGQPPEPPPPMDGTTAEPPGWSKRDRGILYSSGTFEQYAAKAGRQVENFAKQTERSRFDYISTPDQSLYADRAIRAALQGAGFNPGETAEIEDEHIPQGYRRYGIATDGTARETSDAPADDGVIRDPGRWPGPGKGRRLEFTEFGKPTIASATGSDETGWDWEKESSTNSGQFVPLRKDGDYDPGYGKLYETDENGGERLIADVKKTDRDRYNARNRAASRPAPLPPSTAVEAARAIRAEWQSSRGLNPTEASHIAASANFRAPARVGVGESAHSYERFLEAATKGVGISYAERYVEAQPGGSDPTSAAIAAFNSVSERSANIWNRVASGELADEDAAAGAIGTAFGEDPESAQVRSLASSAMGARSSAARRALTLEDVQWRPTGGRKLDIANARDAISAVGRQVDLKYIAGDGSQRLGRAVPNFVEGTFSYVKQTGTDPDGNVQTEVTASHETVQRGYAMAQSAFSQAVSGPLPSANNPKELMSSIRERMYSALREEVTREVDGATQSGMTGTDAKKWGSVLEEISGYFSKAIQKRVQGFINDQFGGGDHAADTSRDIRAASPEDARGLYARSKAIQQQVGQSGYSLDQIMASGKQFNVTDEEGFTYDIGQVQEGGPRRQRSGGGIWGSAGGVGMAMYGAYMLSREWKMAMGEQMQDAKAFSGFVSSVSGMAMPEGMDATRSIAGANARGELSQLYRGQAAYDVLGAFGSLDYQMSGYGDGWARMGTYARLGGGVAGAGVIGSGVLSMTPGLAGLAPVALGAGLAIGGGILGGGLALEAINAATGSDYSLGGAFKSVQMLGISARATGAAAFERGESFIPAFLKSGSKISSSIINGLFYGQAGGTLDADVLEQLTQEEKDIIFGVGETPEIKALLEQAKHVTRSSGLEISQSVDTIQTLKRLTGSGEGADFFASRGVREGYTGSQYVNEAAQYAAAFGMLPGTSEMGAQMREYAGQDAAGRSLLDFKAGRVSALGSQLQAQMGSGPQYYGLGAKLVTGLGLQTQQQIAPISSAIGALQTFGPTLDQGGLTRVGVMMSGVSPYAGSAISRAMSTAGAAGMSQPMMMSIGETLSGIGMSNQQATLFDQILGGDMGAMSYQAWQNGTYSQRFFDQAGNPIWQTNGQDAMRMMSSYAGDARFSQFGFLNAGAATLQPGAVQSQAAGFLGTDNQAIVGAFLKSGTRGIEALARRSAADAQMAQAGIQLRGIALQENFMWGANAGGTYNAPASGSMWFLEDQMRERQHQSSLYNFDYQRTQMDFQNEFGIRREENQLQRMNVSQGYNQWQMDFNRSASLQQRSWQQQDWRYEDTVRGLNYEWQMEDLGEAIRFSSGRQRRQLIKQRDRAGLSHNLEEDQIDETRERQKQVWAQEDERYQKLKDYTAELNRLDQQSYQMNKEQRERSYQMELEHWGRQKEQYEEQKALQDEMQALQRKYQYEQLQLQKEAANAAAGAAAAQREYADALLNANINAGDFVGIFENLNKYDNAFRLTNALKAMAETFERTNTAKVQKIIDLLNAVIRAGNALN